MQVRVTELCYSAELWGHGMEVSRESLARSSEHLELMGLAHKPYFHHLRCYSFSSIASSGVKGV